MANSPYEEMFGSRAARGRKEGEDGSTSMFPLVHSIPHGTSARSRAMTVLRNRYADELREIYLAELARLNGVESGEALIRAHYAKRYGLGDGVD